VSRVRNVVQVLQMHAMRVCYAWETWRAMRNVVFLRVKIVVCARAKT